MRSEVEYERFQEEQAMAEHVGACMAAIMADNDASTLADLQRDAYKYTDAGISVGFQLDDGTYIWNGDKRARDPTLVTRVGRIGFSSIVEGSDREVALTWLDLATTETPDAAVAEYDRMTQETNDEACRLWEEEHADDDEATP